MAQVAQRSSVQGTIDACEWKSTSTKGGDGIPPLGSNTYTCSCKYCKAILKETEGWTKATKDDVNVAIKIGDRVLIQGSLPGIVKYIGDLDSDYTNDQIYIGVKLDDPVGDHDGVFNNKRFFECPNMHGVIVPIEEVNILVPSDGRTITATKDSASRFYSMPEITNLDSITSPSSKEDSITSLQTLSEGRITTPLPEYNFHATVTAPSTDLAGPTQEDECRLSDEDDECCPKRSHVMLLKEDGVTRSSVFICDQPGSIVSHIASSQSANSMKAKLLQNLSCHSTTADDVTLDNLCEGVKGRDVVQSAEVDSTNSQLPTGQAAILSSSKVPATRPPSALKPKGLLHIKKLANNSCSTGAVNTRPSAGKEKMACSKSAACSTSLKRSGPTTSIVSKLATNTVTAPISKMTTSAKCTNSKNVDKETSHSEVKSTTIQDDEETCVVVDIEEEEDQLNQATKDGTAQVDNKDGRPPEVPRLLLVSDSNEDEEPSTTETDMEPTVSYTGRLLSSLPMDDAVTPLSVSVQIDDAVDFDEWAEKWGGGAKGWAQAQTLQKLKEAQRKGLKEVEWQQTIDELEKDEEYAPRVRSIKNLREEITNVRKRNSEIEAEIQDHKSLLHSSDIRKELEELEQQAKALRQVNQALLEQVIDHPLFDLVREAVEYLGIEVKSTDDAPIQSDARADGEVNEQPTADMKAADQIPSQ